MSEDGHEVRHWRLYCQNMVEFGDKVLSCTEGLDRDAFVSEDVIYDVTLRNIELIREAATHITAVVRDAYPKIQWRQIIGARHPVAHANVGLDDDVIWEIVRTDIPRLLPALRNLLDSTDEGSKER